MSEKNRKPNYSYKPKDRTQILRMMWIIADKIMFVRKNQRIQVFIVAFSKSSFEMNFVAVSI